jgi:signal transduction histidine kinase
VYPEDREFMASMMKRMLSDNSGFDVTKRIMREGEDVRYVRCVGTAVSDDAPSRRIGVAIDVTHHEVLTHELRRREAYLAEAQKLSHTGSFGWKPAGGEILCSDETCRIYECQPAKKVTLDKIVEQVHPDDRALVLETAKRASSTGESIDFTHRLLFADGRVKYLHVLATPFRGACDELEFAGAVTDLTERKNAEENIRRAEDHLRDTRIKLAKASRLATVAELAGSIAHELNQPLMSMLANAQAAKKWLSGAPSNLTEVRSLIERIIRDARAADETMQHIRALFKQEAFDKSDVNIPNILREVVRVVQDDHKKRDVPIECQFDASLPAVPADQIQIQQVFINLIVNAIEALEGQKMPPLVVLRATTDSNGMLIQVIDNGPGVDDTDRIFDAFVTTKEKGMGIGLAVSRTIVEAHGGRLWAENCPNGGAKFNIVLPLSSLNKYPAEA